ncbi:titin-like isoform X4 [Rhopilema esculentum]|uniref:titin-like isoform X4 n=1 Tax=Rhopilema esculentum TaxID=499914 RepID=UPI0031DD3A18
MAGNDNMIAASVGVFGIVGLLLLFLVQRSKRKRKRKTSVVVASHVEGEHARPSQEEKVFPHQKLSNERIIYNYLESNYWSKADMHKRILIPDDITQKHFKNVNRITRTTPPILVIYSARSVWELGLSERAESGLKENFSFVMRGPEAPSQRKRRKKIEYVLNDMIQFRKAMKQELLDQKDSVSSLQSLGKRVIPLEYRRIPLREPKVVVSTCEYKQATVPVLSDKEYNLNENSDHHKWKLQDKNEDEFEAPSVCFVIPSPDPEALDLTTRIEIQYKHLLTLWRNRYWHLKQALSASESPSGVKVVHTVAGEKIIEPEFFASGSVDIEDLLKEIGQHVGPIDDEETDEELAFINRQWEKEDILSPKQDEREAEADIVPEEEVLAVSEDQAEQTPGEEVPEAEDELPQESAVPDFEEELNLSVEKLLTWLVSIETRLRSKEIVAMDADSSEDEIREIEVTLQQMTKEQQQYEMIVEKQPEVSSMQLQYKIGVLIEKWSLVSEKLKQWDKRLKQAQVILEIATALDEWLCTVESELISQPGFTMDIEVVSHRLAKLKEILRDFDSSTEDVERLRHASKELGDVELKETYTILMRWENALNETKRRTETLERILPKLVKFEDQIRTEMEWVVTRKETLDAQVPEAPEDLPKLKKEYEAIYEELDSHRKPIQQVYTAGEEFLTESEVFENSLEEYRSFLENCEDNNDRYKDSRDGREVVAEQLQELARLHAIVLQEVPRRIDLILEEIVEEEEQFSGDGTEAEEKAKEWGEKCEALLDFIEKAEVKLAKQEFKFNEGLETDKEYFENLLTEVHEQEDNVDLTVGRGRRFLQGARSKLTPELRLNLESKMTALELRWAKLQSECEGRNQKLDMIHGMLMKFEGTLNPFMTWLQSAEEQAACFHINAPDSESVRELMKKHQQFVDAVKRREVDLQKVNHHGEAFLAEAKAFQKELENYLASVPEAISSAVGSSGQTWVLEQKLHNINDRYRKLIRAIHFKGNLLNESLQKHLEYDEKVNNFMPWLVDIERKFTKESQEAVPSDSKKILKRIEVIKVFQNALEENYVEVVGIRMAGEILSGLDKRDIEHAVGCYVTTQPPGTWIRTTTAIAKRFEEVKVNFSGLNSRLQTVLVTVQNFKDGLDSMYKWSEQTKKTFERMTAVTFDIYILQQQIREIKTMSLDIEGRKASQDALNETYNLKRRDGQAQKYHERMQKINRAFSELQFKTGRRKDDIVSVYQKIVVQFEEWLIKVKKRLDSGEVLTTDIILFEEQLTRITEDVESHRYDFQLINQCGHELVNLEQDRKSSHLLPILDSVNKNWQAVALQLINHSRRFDEVVKCAEKYHGIKQPLMLWLDKMEGKVTTLRPVSVQPHIVLEQMSEQKMLLNETYNQKGTVEILTNISKQLAAIVKIDSQEPQSISAIEEEVKSIRERFTDVVTILEARGSNIDVTLSQTDKYNIAFNEVSMLMESAEGFILRQGPISDDLDVLQKQLGEQRALQKDLAQGTQDVYYVLGLGNDLVGNRDDVDGAKLIRNQVDSISAKWEEINLQAGERQRHLEDAVARSFHRDVTALQNWLDSTEREVNIFVGKKPTETEVEQYVQKLMEEANDYERLIFVVRLIANDLIQSGGNEAQQIVKIKSHLDQKWTALSKKLQGTAILKGRVTLRLLFDETKFKDLDDESMTILPETRKRRFTESPHECAVDSKAIHIERGTDETISNGDHEQTLVATGVEQTFLLQQNTVNVDQETNITTIETPGIQGSPFTSIEIRRKDEKKLDEDKSREVVFKTTKIKPVKLSSIEKELPKENQLIQVERVFVTRILRERDGSERVVESSETVLPYDVGREEEEEPEKVEEVKDSRGRVTKRITTSEVFLETRKKLVKKSQVMPDGSEEPLETKVAEPEDTKEVKAPVIKRIVKRVVQQPDGRERVVEEPKSVKPIEFTETKEDSKPDVTEKRERGKRVRIFTKKVVETFQRKTVKRVTKKPDGKQEGPVEEEVLKPVEPVSYRIVRKTVHHPDGTVSTSEEPDFKMPEDAKESVEEIKDRRGNVVRRVTTRPVPMITVRRVYRTIIIAPDGREVSVQERVEEREKEKGVDEVKTRKEEHEEVVTLMDVGQVESLPSEPREEKLPSEEKTVVSKDGIEIRRTVTIRKRIVKRIIVMPDGTRREVEEEVEEPVDTPAGDDYLVIDRETEKVTRRVEEPEERPEMVPERKPRREPTQKPDSGLKEEPEEPISRMVVVEDESAPMESPEEPEKETVTSVTADGRVIRKTVTVRKRIVRRIIQLPDGTRKEIEEEVPVSADEKDIVEGMEVTVDGREERVLPVEDVTVVRRETTHKEPRHVERVFVTRILRERDGSERVVESSETVLPYDVGREDEEEPEKVEEVKDSRGRVTKRITTSEVFLETRRKLVKKSQVMPDGSEEPLETKVAEPENTKEVKAPVIKRIVKRVVQQPDGRERVVEEPKSVKPIEFTETKEDSKPDVNEKRERGKRVRIFTKKVVETFQRKTVKRVTKKPDGKQEGPVEEEVLKPVEPVSYRIVRKTVHHPDGTVSTSEEPDFKMPEDAKESVEEIKDRRGNVVRRVTTRPVPMITVRRVYRTIIIAPDGREVSVQERVEEREKEKGVDEVKTRKEEHEEVVTLMDVGQVESLPSEPREEKLPSEEKTVVSKDGIEIRRTVTIRKRIVKRIIVMPDGTRREVEEEVEEPVDTPAGDDYLVIDRETEKVTRRVEEPEERPEMVPERKPRREPTQKPDSGLKEEPEEPISRMVVVEDESAPMETPEEPEKETVTSVTADGRVIRKTVTVRKRIVRRIIQLPDGTRKEIEEEVPVSADEKDIVEGMEVTVDGREERVLPVEDVTVVRRETTHKEPRHVERVFVTRILRERDGSERVVESSETVLPYDVGREDEEEPEKVEEVKDSRGRVTKRITTSEVFLETRKKLVKKSQVMPDGSEEPLETKVAEPEDTKEVKAPVIKRIVKRVVQQPDGRERVVEEPKSVKPIEFTETKEDSKPDVTERRERGKRVRIFTKKVVETFQRKTVKRVTKKPDGKQEGPVEEEVLKPVEPVSYRIVRKTVHHPDGTVSTSEEPDFKMPEDAKESVEEIKDRRGNVVRRVTTRPVPMITVRRVYRTIIIAPDGREVSVQERVEEREKEKGVDEVKTRKEEHEEVVTLMDVGQVESLPSEPREEKLPSEEKTVVSKDGTEIRRTVTIRKRIVKRIIVMPDGTRREVEEEVEEPVDTPAGDDYLVIDRETEKVTRRVEEPEERPEMVPERKPRREPTQKPDSGLKEEPEEPISRMVVVEDESAPMESPEEPEKETVTSVTADGRVIRKTVTVRKRIVRRIIQLPDGTRKEIEEEVPVSADEKDIVEGMEVTVDGREKMVLPVEDVTVVRRETTHKEPRHVERVFVTRILRERDGSERVVESSETVLPYDVGREDEEEPEKVEEVKDSRGRVTKRITTSEVFLETRRKLVKKSQVMPDGSEEPLETKVAEPEDTKEVKAPVIKRIVKRVVQQPDGRERVVEEPKSVKPIEFTETKEDSKPDVNEKRERGKRVRIFTKKVVETFQRKTVKRVTKKPDGKQEGPEEVVRFKLVDVDFSESPNLQESVEDVKDKKGIVIRRIVLKAVPVVTTRKVFRTIVVSSDGKEESVQERVEDFKKHSKVAPLTELKVDLPVDDFIDASDMSTDMSSELCIPNIKPKLVERVSVSYVVRHDDGTEQQIKKSDTISPMYPDSDDEKGEYTEVSKNEKGDVLVTVTPVYYLTKKELTRKTKIDSFGHEEIVDEKVINEEKSEIKAPVIKRQVKKMIEDPAGEERVVEDVEYVEPFEVIEEEEEGKPDVTEKFESGTRFKILERKVTKTLKKKFYRRTYHKTTGMKERPSEEVTIRYVEPIDYKVVERKEQDKDGNEVVLKEPKYVFPEDALPMSKDVKDKKGDVVKKILLEPKPVITARRISRVIVLAPDGTQQSVQENVDENDQVPQLERHSSQRSYDKVNISYSTSATQSGYGKSQLSDVTGKKITSFAVSEESNVTESEKVNYFVKEEIQGTQMQPMVEAFSRVTEVEDSATTDVTVAVQMAGTEKMEPNKVEKVYNTKIVLNEDGTERVIETSETIIPVFMSGKQFARNGTFIKRERMYEKLYNVDDEGEETLYQSKEIEPEKVVDLGDSCDEIISDQDDPKPLRVFITKDEGLPEKTTIREKDRSVQLIKRKVREIDIKQVERLQGVDHGVPIEEAVLPVEPISVTYVKKVLDRGDETSVEIEEPMYKMPEGLTDTVEEEKDNHGKVLRKIVSKPLPAVTSKKVFRTVFVTSKGSEIRRSEHTEDTLKMTELKDSETKPKIERVVAEAALEEVRKDEHTMDLPVGSISDTEPRFVIRDGKKFFAKEINAVEAEIPSGLEIVPKHPKKVERIFSTIIERSTSGQDTIKEQSEAILPIGQYEEDVEKVDTIKNNRGTVVNKVKTSPIAISISSTSIHKSAVLSDGKEIPKGTTVVQKEEPQETVMPVVRNVVKGKLKGKAGTALYFKEKKLVPKLETLLKKEHGENVRVVKRKSVCRDFKKAIKRQWKTADGKPEGPEEQLIIEPVEVTDYKVVEKKVKEPGKKEKETLETSYLLPSESFKEPEEIKDKKGVVIKRITKLPLPVITARKVYRITIISPNGEELSTDEKAVDQELPCEPQEDVEEAKLSFFPAPVTAATEKPKDQSRHPAKKSPEAARKSPTQRNKSSVEDETRETSPVSGKKLPVSGKKPKVDEKQTPSPETKPSTTGRPVVDETGKTSPVSGKKLPVSGKKPKVDEKRTPSTEAKPSTTDRPVVDETGKTSPVSGKKLPVSGKKPKVDEKRTPSPDAKPSTTDRPVVDETGKTSPVSGKKLPVSGKKPKVDEKRTPSPDAKPSTTDRPVVDETGKTSPVSGKKLPVSGKKPKVDEKRTPSPEARPSTDRTKKEQLPQKVRKEKVHTTIQPKAEAVEELIPFTFTDDVESTPDILEPMLDSNVVFGMTDAPRMTVDEKEAIGRELFQDEFSDEEDFKPQEKPVKEREIPRRFESAVRKVTYVNYWQKRKESVEKPRLQPVEEHILRFGRQECQLKRHWEVVIKTADVEEDLPDYESHMMWLTFVERELSSSSPVSYRLDDLQEQKTYHESLLEDLENHKATNDALLKAIEKLPSSLEPGTERKEIIEELVDTSTRFNRLLKISEERKKLIEEVEPMVKEENDQIAPVESLNKEAEKILSEKPKVVNIDTIEEKIKQLRDLKQELVEHEKTLGDIKATSAKLSRFRTNEPVKRAATDRCEKVLEKREEIIRLTDGQLFALEKQRDKAKAFYDAVKEIDDWRPKIEDSLGEEEPVSKDIDHLKSQLVKYEGLRKELDSKRPNVVLIQDNSRWLIQNLYETDARGRRHSTADDIFEKLNKTNNVVENINDRVSARLQKLKVFIAEVEDFQELIDNFEKWLKGTEKNLETFKVLPFTVKETKSVQEKFQPLYEDIMNHDALFGELLRRGQQQTDALQPGREKEKTSKRIKDISDRWQKINRTAKERNEKISRLYPCVVDYYESKSVLEDVIKSGENCLKVVSSSGFDVETGRKQLNEIRKTLNGFDRQEELVVFMTRSATAIEGYVSDKSVLSLKKGCRNCADKFSEVRRKLKDKEIAIERDLHDVEQLENLFLTIEDRKMVIEQLQNEVNESSTELDDIQRNLEITKEIMVIVMEIITIIEIIEKLIIVVKKKYRDSSTILKTIVTKESEIKVIRTWTIETSEVIVEKQKSIEIKLGKQEDVTKELAQVSEELSMIEAHLLTQTPISADYHVLRSQQSEHSAITLETSSLQHSVKQVVEDVKEKLKNVEAEKEKMSLSAAINDIERRWDVVNKKVTSRQNSIKKLHPSAEVYRSESEKLMPWLLTVDKDIALVKPLSSRLEVLVQQKRAIEDLVKESEQRKVVLERCKSSAKMLLDISGTESKDKQIVDQETVKEEVSFFSKKFQVVSEKLNDVRKQAENIEKELTVFYDKERVLEDLLEEVDDIVDGKCAVSTLPEKCTQRLETLKSFIARVDNQENDLKAFTKAADNLHKLMDQYESEDEEITDKKVHLNERFRNARAKLTERLSDSDQVLNKAKLFSDAVKESYKLVTNLTEKTEPKLKGMPSDVKKLESLVKDVEDSMMELVNIRVKLENGKNYGDWLIEKSRQNPLVVNEVTGRIGEVTKSADKISRHLSVFKKELENKLIQQKGFVELVEDFGAKLEKAEQKVNRLRPVSARYLTARKQHEDFKPIFREIQSLKQVSDAVMVEKEKTEHGTDSALLSSETDESKKDAAKKVSEFESRWEALWKRATAYHIQITSVLPFEEMYHYTVLKFAPWIEDAEKALSDVEKAKDDTLTKKKIKVLQDDIIEHVHLQQNVESCADALFQSYETNKITADVSQVREEKQDLIDRWERLRSNVKEVAKKTSQVEKALAEYESVVTPVEELIVQVERKLEEELPMSWDVLEMEDYLQKLNFSVEEMDSHEGQVAEVANAEKRVEEVTRHKAGDEPRTKTVETTTNKWKVVKDRLVEKQKKDESKLKQVVQYVSLTGELESWLKDTSLAVMKIKSDSDNVDDLSHQLDHATIMHEEVAKQQMKLESAEHAAERLIANNEDKPQFVANVKAKIASIKKPLSEVSAFLVERRAKFQTAVLEMQDLDQTRENYEQSAVKINQKLDAQSFTTLDYETLAKQEDMLKAIDSEALSLKAIQEKFSELSKSKIEETRSMRQKELLNSRIQESFVTYEKVCSDLKSNKAKINQLLGPSKIFADKEKTFAVVLKRVELKSMELEEIPIEAATIPSIVEESNVLMKDVEDHEVLYQDMVKIFKELLVAAKKEVPDCQFEDDEKKVNGYVDRWEKTKRKVSKKQSESKELLALFTRYRNLHGKVHDGLPKQIDSALKESMINGTNTKKTAEELKRLRYVFFANNLIDIPLSLFCPISNWFF